MLLSVTVALDRRLPPIGLAAAAAADKSVTVAFARRLPLPVDVGMIDALSLSKAMRMDWRTKRELRKTGVDANRLSDSWKSNGYTRSVVVSRY